MEESHVADDEVTLAAVIEDFAAEPLVGTARGVQATFEDVAGEPIGKQVHLDSSGLKLAITVAREGFVVRSVHGDHSTVFDEETFNG